MNKTTSVLNASVSKEQHAFAKSSCFVKLNSYTRNFDTETYTKLSDFDMTVKRGKSKEKHCFRSRNDRFAYTPNPRKHG